MSAEPEFGAARIDLKASVSSHLAHTFPGVSGDWQIEAPVYSSVQSRIFPLVRSPYGDRVAVKEIRPEGEKCTTHFEGLTRVYNKMRTPYRVVKPLAVLEDSNAFIMEWISGRNIFEVIRGNWYSAQRTGCTLRACGSWLRQLHEIARTDVQKMFEGSRLAYLKGALANHQFAPPEKPAMERILLVLDRFAAACSGHDFPCAVAHGDFKPTNLIQQGQDIIGIDLAGGFQRIILFDIAHFLNFLSLSVWTPSGVGLLAMVGNMERRFAEGYGLDEFDLPAGSIAWFRLHNLLMDWVSLEQESAPSFRKNMKRAIFGLSAKKLEKSLTGVMAIGKY